MKYRKDRYGTEISQLGYGCMRFTRKGAGIDYEKAEKEVLLAYEKGVNYFDTAYIYPGSEECLGRILAENHIRDKVYVATKLPQYLMHSERAIEKTFREELSRLRTDYIDYYLMHMFTDVLEWDNLKKLGIENWIRARKEEGSIRRIGFSFHGNTETFLEILHAYDWDFCQIQYNYLDETSQAGRRGLEAAAELGIPVIIMEPLRGGKLVNLLPDKAKRMIASDPKHRTPAQLAFRWLWDQEAVTCVLSGMNSLKMVRENCETADSALAGSFDEADLRLIEKVKAAINEKIRVGCTGCGYCMPCPKRIDIPGVFRCYNTMYTEKKVAGWKEYFQTVAMNKETAFPSACINCGKCASHCPQGIAVPQELKKARKALLPLPYKLGLQMARRFVFK